MQRTQPGSETTPLVDDGSNRLLITAGWTLWDNALLLIVCSLLLVCVLAPFVILASVAGWLLAWAPMTLASAPAWLAVVAVSDRLLDGRGVCVRELPRVIRMRWRAAVQLALVPAMLGTLALGLLEAIDRQHGANLARLMLPGAIGALLAITVLIGPAFAVVARTDAGPRVAWLVAARQVARQPVQQIGFVFCFGVLLWLTVLIGPVFLLGLGPLALLSAALARTLTDSIVAVDNSVGNHRP